MSTASKATTVRKKPTQGNWTVSKPLLVMMAAPLLYFIIFHYVPLYGMVIAFKDFRMDLGIFGSQWNGVENFTRLFSGEEFPQALRNTLVIGTLQLCLAFWAPIILALLLNEVRLAGYKRGIQTLTYLPHFFSWVILGGIVLMFLATDGPVNMALRTSGLSPIEFLTNDFWFISTLIFTGIWQGAGWGSIIYLAALSGIPSEQYEAAVVDGATRWQQCWHITLPSLRPTIVILLILSLGGFLNVGFDQIYNLYNPLVYDVADVLDTYVLRRLQTMDFSLAAAAGFFKSIVGFILIVGSNYVARRLSNGEQGIW